MRYATITITATALLALAVAASAAVLPRNTIIPFTVVQRAFPEVTREASVGANATAVGKPTATLSVICANSNATKKVTITVDQYTSASAAVSAYQEAVQRSKAVPEYKPITVPNFGQKSFGGKVTRGTETHVGVGALSGTLIIGATLAGYDATSANVAKLVNVARTQLARSVAHK